MVTRDLLQKYGSMFGRGLLATEAPRLVKGALIESLKNNQVDVKKASLWVEKNVTLWNKLSLYNQKGIRRLRQMAGEPDWLTTEWVIDSLKKDMPALASLFLGWEKANNWLNRQVRIIREKLGE